MTPTVYVHGFEPERVYVRLIQAHVEKQAGPPASIVVGPRINLPRSSKKAHAMSRPPYNRAAPLIFA